MRGKARKVTSLATALIVLSLLFAVVPLASWQPATASPGPARTWQWAHTEDETDFTSSYAVYETLQWTPGAAGDWLVMGYADCDASDGTDKVYIKLEHNYGGSYITVSEKIAESYSTTDARHKAYFMIGRIQVSEENKDTEITARIQAYQDTAPTPGGSIKNRRIVAIPLGTGNTDYWYDENLSAGTFGTSGLNILEIDTSSIAAGDYLIVSDVDFRASSTSYSAHIGWTVADDGSSEYLHGYWGSGSDAGVLLEREDNDERGRAPFFGIVTLPFTYPKLRMWADSESGDASYWNARMFLIDVDSISGEYEKTSSLDWTTGATSGTKNSITSFSQTHTGKYLVGSCSMLDPGSAGYQIGSELYVEDTRVDGQHSEMFGDSSDLFGVAKFWIEDYGDTGSRNYYQKYTTDRSAARIGFAYLFVIGEKVPGEPPAAPINIKCENEINPTGVTDQTPDLGAEYDDPDAEDIAAYYQCQVIEDGGSWASPKWDSTKTACTVNEGSRKEIVYGGSALPLDGKKYYQRWKFWDDDGNEGSWSAGTDYWVMAQAPSAPTLYNIDTVTEEQISFNNVKQNTTTPRFRASATHTADFNRFQIELNDQADFGGTSYNQTFSGTYVSGTQYNLLADSLSPSLPTTDGATYYVRARASADGGSNWGDWSSATWSFTYNAADEDPMWFQTTDEQFETGNLSQTATDDPNDRVKLAGAAGGWLSGWDYRKQLPITGQSGAGTDYQVKITVGYSSGGDVHCEGHCQTDFDDIRFTDDDGTTLLDHWRESYTASDNAVFWVEVKDNLDSDQNIYIYYENSGASTTSNFDNTFTKDYGESGLAGLWHMDEGSGTTTADSSGNGNTGDLIGGLGWVGSDGGEWDNRSDVSFSTGDCLSFDGTTKYVEVDDSTSLDITDDITIEAWVKPTWGTYPDWGMVYIDWYDDTNQSVHFSLYYGKVSLYISSSGSNSDNLDGNTALPLNQWSHIAVTFDSGTLYVYLNGQKDATQKVSSTVTSIFNSGYAKTIGIKNEAAHGAPFNGPVDEVRIYNRALSEDEIKCQYERRKYASPEPSLGTPGAEETGIGATGTITSTKIDFDWVSGATSWDKVSWNADTSAGTISVKVQKYTTSWVDTGISGSTSPLDISSLGTESQIRLVATLTKGTGTPYLQDWTVTWVTNTPPTVDAVALYQSDESTLISPGGSMDPQVEYAVKVTITDANTLDDINEVKITIFYDSVGDDPAVPGTSNTQTCAIITWTKGSGWSIDPSTGTSWVLVTGNCKTPTMSATSGDWWAHFKPGKVATQSGVADDWDIYAKATDAAAESAELYTRDYEMSWYGEVAVNTVEVNFGTVELGSDFSANEQTGISVTYIANGAYNEQVKASSPWGTAPNQATLNASGNPGDGEFSLKANDTATLGDAVLVSSTAFTTFDSGTQTGESGNVESSNTLWLKLGLAGIAAVTYNGTIYYRITQ